jgi:lipopolysaccharide/colanic/teichoic acid biosynthesis glycosyltransferase
VARKRRTKEPGTGFAYKYVKRAFDLVSASLALVVLAPVLGVIAALIKLSGPGPAFFLQERTGKDGKPFFIYKFRTMVPDAARLGPGVTGAGDPRVTRVGNLLRVTKFDELPNLLNVVRGEMSLVGPRPDLPRFMSALTPEQRKILTFRPGLTGPTQLRYIAEEELLSPVNIDENYIENLFADKIASDLDYVSNWSMRKDLLLILYTPVALAFTALGRLTRLFPVRRPPYPGGERKN